MKAQTALNMDERRQVEKRKNNSSDTAPSNPGSRNTRVCSWGSAAALSHGLSVTEAVNTTRAPHKGTFAKLFFGPLSTAEFSRSQYENFTHSQKFSVSQN